jgi:hypothetical protein
MNYGGGTLAGRFETTVILSEAKNLPWFCEILRCAQNDEKWLQGTARAIVDPRAAGLYIVRTLPPQPRMIERQGEP